MSGIGSRKARASLAVDLVIFDCDGVLVDSEMIACEIGAEAWCELGFNISAQDVAHHFIGVSVREWHAEVARRSGITIPEGFEAAVEAKTKAAFTKMLRPMPGILKALAAIQMPVCVASNSTPDRIRHSLSLVGLIDHFEPHIFSASMVKRGKPAPDLFLFAAAEMGVDPPRCVVVEDSVPGTQAAASAGMAVLGFCGGSHCTAEHSDRLLREGAMLTWTDMARLPEILNA
ncbi:MAG TPA: HAD family hydrolase [Casimicrobiaceae bacterium]|nr:HAD family hydrolase [Casimicrobiaceae bacterium]